MYKCAGRGWKQQAWRGYTIKRTYLEQMGNSGEDRAMRFASNRSVSLKSKAEGFKIDLM